MEQLTKAQMAFEEIAWLAKSLNRTLVLPKVGSSTIGVSKLNKLPFSTYFDVGQLSRYVPTIKYVQIITYIH
jgi:membrane protein YqaA with SNARE-associated domain